MIKRISLIAFALAAAVSFAQAPATNTPPPVSSEGSSGMVTVSARGADVRGVIHEVFAQVNRSYVLDPTIRFSLYLSLSDVEFEKALAMICRTAALEFQVQGGVYVITRAKTESAAAANPTFSQVPIVKQGRLPNTVLQRRITTRLTKAPLRSVMAEIGRQAGIKIELDDSVPAYSLDAYLIDTSLKFALDTVTRAAKLEYSFTDNQSIVITRPSPNRVELVRTGS